MKIFAVQVDEEGISFCNLTPEGLEQINNPEYEGSKLWKEWEGRFSAKDAITKFAAEISSIDE